MQDLIPAIVSSLLLIALAAGFFLRDRAHRLERKRELSRLGFHPSPEQIENLVEIVTTVENNATYWHSVDHHLSRRLVLPFGGKRTNDLECERTAVPFQKTVRLLKALHL